MWGWRWRCLSHLDSRLAEVHPPGQLLPHEGVGVMRPLKDPLQSLQLAAVERGAVPPLLLLPFGHSTARAQALTWGKSQQKPRETPQNPASKDSVFTDSNEFNHETSQRPPIPISHPRGAAACGTEPHPHTRSKHNHGSWSSASSTLISAFACLWKHQVYDSDWFHHINLGLSARLR